MQFQTQIPIPKTNNPIDYSSRIVSLGSCFAENIADKFDYFKFQNTSNPFGIIFNPISIEKIIQRIVQKKYFIEEDIFYHNDLWHCYETHSELSNPNKENILNILNQLIESTNEYITKSTHIIITLGTAWVYRNIESKEIVANCHKMPQKYFSKEIIPVDTIKKSLLKSVALIQSINKNAKIIFTVSPVRHIKDGFVENNLSKSNLISALHSALFQLPSSCYFPSYEILLDELRDYRFYTQDMLHPNQLAIDYIWERFLLTQISESIYPTMQEVCTVQKGLAHRPFNPETESHQKFLRALSQKIVLLSAQFPLIKF